MQVRWIDALIKCISECESTSVYVLLYVSMCASVRSFNCVESPCASLMQCKCIFHVSQHLEHCHSCHLAAMWVRVSEREQWKWTNTQRPTRGQVVHYFFLPPLATFSVFHGDANERTERERERESEKGAHTYKGHENVEHSTVNSSTFKEYETLLFFIFLRQPCSCTCVLSHTHTQRDTHTHTHTGIETQRDVTCASEWLPWFSTFLYVNLYRCLLSSCLLRVSCGPYGCVHYDSWFRIKEETSIPVGCVSIARHLSCVFISFNWAAILFSLLFFIPASYCSFSFSPE